jgi:hypothetical protein
MKQNRVVMRTALHMIRVVSFLFRLLPVLQIRLNKGMDASIACLAAAAVKKARPQAACHTPPNKFEKRRPAPHADPSPLPIDCEAIAYLSLLHHRKVYPRRAQPVDERHRVAVENGARGEDSAGLDGGRECRALLEEAAR